MKNTNAFEGLDEYSVRLIIFKSKRLCRQAGLTSSDLEDVEMDLVIYLRRRLEQYDAERGERTTFINCVLENRVRELVNKRKRPTCDYRMNDFSLDEICTDKRGGSISRGDLIDDDEYSIRLGNLSRPRMEQVEMRIDVHRALDLLPPKWREICLLMADHSMVEVARITGTKRHQLYIIRKRVQEIFRQHGLDGYL